MFDSFTKYNINQYYCFNCFFISLERNVFISLNVWNRCLRKYLKTLANKISGIMWGWEISTWRMEHSNHLPKSHHGCNLRCGNLGCNLAVHTFVKISRLNFLWIPEPNAPNKWFQIQNIHHPVLLQKDESFLVCLNHFIRMI